MTHLRCDWFSAILMEHIDSKNKISLDPRLHPLSRGKGTPVTGQGVMKRKWGTLLGLLCIQICCESGSSQRGDWGGSTVDSEREGRRADLGLLDGPTSSGVSDIVYRSGNCTHDSPVTSFVLASLSFQAGVKAPQ